MAGTSLAVRIQNGLTEWREKLKSNGRALAASLGAGGIVGYWLLNLLADHYADSLLGKVAVAVLAFLAVLAQRPIGYGLLLVLLTGTLVAVIVAFRVREKPLPPPLQLSADEKDAIARLRKLWYDEHGGEFGNALVYMLDDAISEKDKYRARVFEVTKADLEAHGKNLSDALNISTPTPLKTVVGAFEEFFKACLRTAETLYLAHQAGDYSLNLKHHRSRYKQVLKSYAGFKEGYVHANNYPGMDRLLKFFAVQGGTYPSRQFLGEQEWDGIPLDEKPT